jgi:hypothetical protein
MGPYIITDLALLDSLPGSDAVIPDSDKAYGIQCVGLVKKYSQAGGTASWSQGDKVMDSPLLKRGTAIATFNDKGKYASHATGNHACFFIKSVGKGFVVLEQHVKPDPDKIQTRTIMSRGDKWVSVCDNADSYSVIL